MKQVVRIAAKGDGVTEDGRHIAMTAPGDLVSPDGQVQAGPHRAEPPCRHFPKCGGCQLQHIDEASLRQFTADRVLHAARSQSLEPEEWLPPVLVPPASRRRTTLHALRQGRKVLLGYKQERSHRIVDVRECPVVVPSLVALFSPLRRLLERIAGRHPVDIALTQVDQGVDCAIGPVEIDGLDGIDAVTEFARNHSLARLSIDQGFGAETMWEPQPVTVTLSGTPVAFPPAAFLQPAREGEQVMIDDARKWLADSKRVADLFAGLGTFTFALAEDTRAVTAFEAHRESHFACRSAALRRGHADAQHRDLFRNPLQVGELKAYDGVLLDPPRAGAKEQIDQLAQSEVERIVYVSCNPASWARDARRLIDGGYRLIQARPVGQFRWSTHVELTSLFCR